MKKISKMIWEYISNNLIISGLIVAIVGGVITTVIMLPKTTDPSGSKKKLAKAQVFLDKGYSERAKTLFSHILLEHRDNNYVTTIALAGRANVYLHQQNFKRAIQDANDAIDINKDNSDAYCILGRAYSLKEEHEKAIENFNEALERGAKRKEDIYLYRGIEYYILKYSLSFGQQNHLKKVRFKNTTVQS